MELYLVRGGSKRDLEDKKYNIGVGVSIGNKWFTPKNVLGLVQWSLKFTKERVVVYVADTIHAINVEVRRKRSRESSLKYAKQQGKTFLKNIKNVLEESMSPTELKKVLYATWDDIVDEEYEQKIALLRSFFEKDIPFRKKIVGITREHLSTENKQFTEEQTLRLSEYIIEELPELLNRVPIGGFVYDACAYPFDSEVTKLVEQIQKGEVFSEIKRSVMDTEPKVFLEVR